MTTNNTISNFYNAAERRAAKIYQIPNEAQQIARTHPSHLRRHPNYMIAVCNSAKYFISADGVIRPIADRSLYGDKIFLKRRLASDIEAPTGFTLKQISRDEAKDVLLFTRQPLKVFACRKYNKSEK